MKNAYKSKGAVNVRLMNADDIDPSMLENGGSKKLFINGKEYQADQIPEQLQSVVADLTDGNQYLTEDTTNLLDQSPQLKKIETGMYILVQLFSLGTGFTINNIRFAFIDMTIPWYVTLILSLIAGHIATKLAEKSIQNNQQKIAQSGQAVPLYFFNRFSKVLVAFQVGGYAIFLYILLYGATLVILSVIK